MLWFIVSLNLFTNILKFCAFLSRCNCCLLVHKTQINLASMAASRALSTPMILNSHSHNNARDQPHHFTGIKPPWHAQFIIHFALSHCSQKDHHMALVLVCEEALWHPAWCTFHGSHSCPTWRERHKERTPPHKCGLFGLQLMPGTLNKWSKCLPEIVLPLTPLSNDTRVVVGSIAPPLALWRPARMNMRKWGRHPVNNSCHCAPQQMAGLGVGWRGGGALHDMPGPDMAPRPRAVTPAETSRSPPQFVHLTLQLAHDRCLFPRTGFFPLQWCLWAQGTHGIWYGCLSTKLLAVKECEYTSDTFHFRSHCIFRPLNMASLCLNVCVYAWGGQKSRVRLF